MHILQRTQVVPISLSEAWLFFSSPLNLKEITPDYMGFEVLEGGVESMYAGQIIRYKVSPFFGLRLSWVTEITHVSEGEYFVDEQRFGPYRFWHHKHYLAKVNGGTEIRDVVHYKLPFGILGKLAVHFFVKKQLNEIFDYRAKKLKELFADQHI